MAKKFNLADYVQSEARSDSDHMEIREIPLAKIIDNPRNIYGVRAVEELAESLQLNGQLEPLIVYPYGTSAELYRLLSGHRRLAALRMNKAETALCRVMAKPENAAREDILIIQANAQRVKTPGELAAEAAKMTAALVALKKQGVELPGRLRDAVADAMGVSSSKLARIQAIEANLRVPGFKAAWKDGKLPEAAAYELAQLNEADQYSALDLLIDEGVDYEHADIKAVQRIKRRVMLGESTTQELAIQAEKLGIKIRGGDYSPLFAYYVRQAVPEYVQQGLRVLTKAGGIEQLHTWGFGHQVSAGPGYYYYAEPAALTIKEPIGKRLKWSEVWDLLAMDAMARTDSDHSPVILSEAKNLEDPSAAPQDDNPVVPAGWHLCSEEDPPEGQLVCILWDEGSGCEDWFAHVAVFDGVRYMEFGWSTIEVDAPDGAIWAPLADNWHELGTKAKKEAFR